MVLSMKRSNLYWMDELSNVCYSPEKCVVFDKHAREQEKIRAIFDHSGRRREELCNLTRSSDCWIGSVL